ncbi:SMP-30/gluconolactonase/LRE family protein [Arenibacter sp. GZD96]|uniref:SMP-30/gluconolactonase/LRE family protein n=1 Tax=Aurantibrevibacter litoralis TaxID=3106030 RepID=UPI002AFFB4A3|nr:SMP-30/gluconolactonase/LRE family protein [Arenibacter sp. GZD-96]MEA1785046.1 SMP-30/gluconolactonase/LRE family protein [Arenibacter sp. GZD-96]
MKTSFFSILTISAGMGLFVPFSHAQENAIIAEGASVTLVASDYSFTEGPAVDNEGNIYFTDQPNDRIVKWNWADNSVSDYITPSGRANGLYVDHKGNLLACADEKNEIWSITPDKKITVLLSDVNGKKLNGPNDLWVDLKGGIYFTDPFYKRNYWDRTEKEIEKEMVYYLSPDLKTLSVVADDLVRPNGIIGSADGKTLYVADIGDSKTYAYTIADDSTLTHKTLFCEMGSDGMTLDHQGNLYVTGKGVTVFNKEGQQIAHIPIAQNWTANVTFGGADQQTLFITAMNSVYTLKMNVKGIR